MREDRTIRNQQTPTGVICLPESLDCNHPPDCREAKRKFHKAISQWAERQSELENSEPAEEQHDLQPAAKESSEGDAFFPF